MRYDNRIHASTRRLRVMGGPAFVGVLAVLAAAVVVVRSGPAFADEPNTPSLDDPSVLIAVEDQIAHDPVVTLDDVDVRVVGGIVTLEGEVDSLLEKERAVRIAKAMRGVRGVVNRLKIDPDSVRSDAIVKKDVQEALHADPATDAYELKVNVGGGVVTLHGAVDSWREDQLARKVAKSVDGVLDVEDAMSVNLMTPRSDGEIQSEIARSLDWDVRVDDRLLQVDVEDGGVRLVGVVRSAAEKDRAEGDAYVMGVKSVDVSGVSVRDWTEGPDVRGRPARRAVEDVKAAVIDALSVDPRVHSFDIEPTLQDGFVTLRGTVDNLKARRCAGADARNVTGVLGVWNRVKVRPPHVADDELEMRALGNVVRDPIVDSHDIEITADDGKIRLDGTVNTYWEKMRAEDLVSRARGVQDVDNALDVRDHYTPLVYGPYVDDLAWANVRWYQPSSYSVPISDRKLKSRVEQEIWWSPFVDLMDVDVAVENGVVRLSGEVDSWSEKHAAIMNAYEAGAGWVVDDLDVNPPKLPPLPKDEEGTPSSTDAEAGLGD